MYARIIATESIVYEGPENDGIRVLYTFAKRDDVDRNVVLLQLLGELDHCTLLGGLALKWRADERDDALTQVLVLPVLERELCDRDSGREICRAFNFPCR